VKFDFVYLQDSFPSTPRSPQLELYNSRYGHFGGSHLARIIARLNFAAKAPLTVLSPRVDGISPKCKLTNLQNTKTPKLTKTLEINKTKSLTNIS
jgi:hypothetical protein